MCMRGNDLDKFWMQLRWMTEDALPKLPAFWRENKGFAGCLGVLAVIGGVIAAWTTSNSAWVRAALFGAVALYLLASIYKRFTNPLPPHIASFRDLSILIAKSRNKAA